MNVKKLLIVIPVALIIFMIAVMTLSSLLFPKERIITFIEQQASDIMAMPVSVGDAGISFAGIPALSVRDITIGPPAWSEKPLAVIDAVKVRMNIRKLLSRQIEITSIDIQKPALYITPAPVDTSAMTASNTVAGKTSVPMLPFPVTMQSLSIGNGSVVFNQPDGSALTLSDIDQKLSLSIDRDMTNMLSKGTLTIGNVSFASPLTPELLDGYALEFIHDVTGNPAENEYVLDDGEIIVNGMHLDLNASTDTEQTTFKLASGTLDASDILALVPGTLLPVRDNVSADGTFSLSFEGSLNHNTPDDALQYAGTIDIPGIRIAYDGAPAAIDNITANMSFDEKNIAINKLAIATGTSALTIDGSASSYLSNPVYDFTVNGNIIMNDVANALPVLAKHDLHGALDLDLKVIGEGTDITAYKPEGAIQLDEFSMILPELLNNPAEITGSVDITPQVLTLNSIQAISGTSDISIKGTFENYLNMLNPALDTPATLKTTVNSEHIDIENLLVIDREKETTVIMPWHLKEPIEAMPVPPNIHAETNVTLGTIQFGKLAADSATGSVSLANGMIDLTNLLVHAYQGTLDGSLSADFSNLEKSTYTTSLGLSDFESGTFLADLFAIEPFMRGTLSSSITLAGAGLDSTAFLENLTGNGDMLFVDGEIDNLDFARKLGETLSFLDFDVVSFKTIANSFYIENQRFYTPDMHIAFNHGDINLDGSVGFDRSIDYVMQFMLDSEASNKAARQINALSELVATDISSIELEVVANGTLDSPAFKIDTSRAKQQITDAAKSKVEDSAREFLEETLQDENLKEKGKALLDKLFK